MEMQELSLEKFEEASEIVKKVTQETKLGDHSDGFSGIAQIARVHDQKAGT